MSVLVRARRGVPVCAAVSRRTNFEKAHTQVPSVDCDVIPNEEEKIVTSIVQKKKKKNLTNINCDVIAPVLSLFDR